MHDRMQDSSFRTAKATGVCFGSRKRQEFSLTAITKEGLRKTKTIQILEFDTVPKYKRYKRAVHEIDRNLFWIPKEIKFATNSESRDSNDALCLLIMLILLIVLITLC